MDKFCYDFDQAIRQINQIRRLHENAQDCLRQAQGARMMMKDLGDGEIVRLLTEALEDRIRDGKQLCDRLEHLEHALRKNLRRFEEMEEELANKIQGIGEDTTIRLISDVPVLWSPAQCQIGELRFADVIYPDFLSQAAENYFASTL